MATLPVYSSTTLTSGYPNKGPVTMHTTGAANPPTHALANTAHMMLQAEKAQRSATTARMQADEATKTAVLELQKQVKDLTALVAKQGAEIAKLTEQQKQKNLVQDAWINDIREKVS